MEKFTVLRLKREVSQSAINGSGGNFGGYQLKVVVDSYHNIDPGIFILQRGAISSYLEEQEDIFITVASVPELHTLPYGAPEDGGSSYYRVKEISLMFGTSQEMEDGWEKISSAALALASANDLAINLQPDIVAFYPEDAFPRYFGASNDDPTVDEILLLTRDVEYSLNLEKIVKLEDSANFTIAVPVSLGRGKLKVDGQDVLINVLTKALTSKYGQEIQYFIHTTQSVLDAGNRIIKFYPE